MPLRDLPTESKAAAALLRTEELEHRRTLRRTQWQSAALGCLIVAATLAVLIPGSASTGCYLWRATTQPVSGRGAALAVPVTVLALLLADRLCADRIWLRPQVRGWGAVALVVVTGTAWVGLATQGRTGCSTSPAVIGVVVCGALASSIAAFWATRSPAPPALLAAPSDVTENSSGEPLDQTELRAAFLRLSPVAENSADLRTTIEPILTGTLAALLLASTVLPWRDLLDPVALGPTGSEAGVARVQLWEIPSAEAWAVVLAVTALATLCAAVATLIVPKPAHLVLRVSAVATGAVVVAGILSALAQLPPRLSDGVGYRVGVGAWLALAFGVLLLALGVTATAFSVRRRAPGWSLRLVLVAVTGLVAVAAGLFVPAAAAPEYRPVVAAGAPHRLLDLQGGQMVDRLGMRVAIGTSDPLDSIAGTLDGTPGQWLLGRTGSEGSTLFEYRDGVALPRVALSHGVTPPALLGVTDNRMVLLAGGPGNRPWAVLSVPLTLVAADISLSHKNADGSYYVTPDVDVLATGQGPALTHRNADRSVVIWGSTSTWQIPANEFRRGMVLKDYLVDPGPGGPGNEVSTGPDGTTAWRTGQTGLALLRPGGVPQQLTGVAPAGCLLSKDAASSSLTVEAFAVDVRGNLWLGGSSPTSVITPDGVLREVPAGPAGVDSIEARPDGSVLLGVSPGGGDQILEITDAADSAGSYPAAPEPAARCDRRKPADGNTQYRATVLPTVQPAEPSVTAEGQPGKAIPGTGMQLGLDAHGKLIRLRVPNAAHAWAPDGLGGVWWTVASRSNPSAEVAVHWTAAGAEAVRDPRPVAPNQRGEFAAAAGGRLVTAISGQFYNFYGPGPQVNRIQLKGALKQDGLVQLGSGDAAMVLGERLVHVSHDGKATTLLGGATSGWPITATGVAADQWTTDGNWFAGPDGKLWGYDGSHLVRVDGPGKVTVIAGPAQGVPQAADQVTVIGKSLYFELGTDVVRLEPTR
ncbi:hypothetical protein EV644_106218 [Kribbella orskensis]|uniref:Uncharacterized protein n=1 Tax=Kribbella orskensis TaxID=2512216 RepID=A0ABY2BJW7_9ACTN|nr:hypothetical protein EV642_105218 [Kribbella sp. VKM Ac-2500]TCO22910.1 hypothetical protein EV644_106218 [Kribbella orskensis]